MGSFVGIDCAARFLIGMTGVCVLGPSWADDSVTVLCLDAAETGVMVRGAGIGSAITAAGEGSRGSTDILARGCTGEGIGCASAIKGVNGVA